jgi:hypothetical protein
VKFLNILEAADEIVPLHVDDDNGACGRCDKGCQGWVLGEVSGDTVLRLLSRNFTSRAAGRNRHSGLKGAGTPLPRVSMRSATFF